MYIKRLLVGSISLSDDSQTLGENGGTASESQVADRGQSSGTAHILLQVLSWWSSTSHLIIVQQVQLFLNKFSMQKEEMYFKVLQTACHLF